MVKPGHSSGLLGQSGRSPLRRVAALTALFFVLAAVAIAGPSGSDEAIVPQVSVTLMMKNLKILAEDIGVRVCSSPEERRAAEFIRDTLTGYGYRVEMQPFPYESPAAYLKVLAPEEKHVQVRTGQRSPFTGREGVSGRVVDCGLGNELTDFPHSVRDNVALVKRADGEDATAVMRKVFRAQRLGAAAVLIYNFDWHIFNAEGKWSDKLQIPFATLNSEAAEALCQPGTKVNLAIVANRRSQNVVAVLKPTAAGTGQIVTVTAHYDSVAAAPGASDNGSGVVAMLEMARIIAKLPRDTEIRFIACGAEEAGLIGSRVYVSRLAGGERTRIVANFNMDMIGTASPEQNKLYVATQDYYDSRIAGSNLASDKLFAAADRLGYREIMAGPICSPGSDHNSFYLAGIAAAGVAWRQPGFEPWYHQPYDTVARISPERLTIGAKVVGAAVYDILSPDSPPVRPVKQ